MSQGTGTVLDKFLVKMISPRSERAVYYQIIIILGLMVSILAAYTAYYRYQKIARVVAQDATVGVFPPSQAAKPAIPPAQTPQDTLPAPLDIEKAAAAGNVHDILPRNILFTFVNYRAASVDLVGDFTQEKKIAMIKEKTGVWRVKAAIVPGTYKYHFTVDGKKMLDPYNPRREQGSSIIIVEPLEKK